MKPQITGSQQDIPQSVKYIVGESGATCAIGENRDTYAVGESRDMYAEPHMNMNVGNTQTMIDRAGSFQPMFVYGGGSNTQHPKDKVHEAP